MFTKPSKADLALRLIVATCTITLCTYIGIGVTYLLSVAGGL